MTELELKANKKIIEAELEQLKDEKKNLHRKLQENENMQVTYRSSLKNISRTQKGIKVEKFKQGLFQNYKEVPEDKLEKVWSKAWNNGHSSGFDEVRIHFEDLIDLVL